MPSLVASTSALAHFVRTNSERRWDIENKHANQYSREFVKHDFSFLYFIFRQLDGFFYFSNSFFNLNVITHQHFFDKYPPN